MHLVRVRVTKDELTKPIHRVPPWELACLEELFDGIEVQEDIYDNREYPDPLIEWERLEMRYQRSRDDNGDPTDILVVEAAFGRRRQGQEALAAAIEHIRKKDEARQTKARQRAAAKADSNEGDGSDAGSAAAA